MNFKQAVDAVIAITSRPDKIAEAIAALNQAITTFTLKANFTQDLVEDTLIVDPNLFGDTIDISSVFIRFRKFKYVKITGVKGYLNPTESDKIFANGITQPNTYYVGGSALTYTISQLTNTLEVGYYRYPPILANDIYNTHWMLDIFPQAVIDTACARVFKIIGDEVSHKIYQQMGMDAYITARSDMQDSVTYGAR